jgi:hypothetical protein
MPVVWPDGGETFPTGDNALHLVSTNWDGLSGGLAAATWTVVDGLGDKTRSNQANTTPHRIFGRRQAITTVGIPDRTITLNGWYAEDDAGQEVLRAAQSAGTEIGYMNVRDYNVGNGYAVKVKVGGGEDRQQAEGGLQPVSFTLAPQDDAVNFTGFDLEIES